MKFNKKQICKSVSSCDFVLVHMMACISIKVNLKCSYKSTTSMVEKVNCMSLTFQVDLSISKMQTIFQSNANIPLAMDRDIAGP